VAAFTDIADIAKHLEIVQSEVPMGMVANDVEADTQDVDIRAASKSR
jgi:hypothetical protein